MAELGGIAGALAATACWLAVAPRGRWPSPAHARRPSVRRMAQVLGLVFGALSLRLFLASGTTAAAILEWTASLTLGFSLLVLAGPTAPRVTRVLVAVSAVTTLVAVMALVASSGSAGRVH